MKPTLRFPALACLLATLAACQDSSVETVQASPEPAQAALALFDDDLSKKACELLTPEMVAETFEVPADAVRQMRIVGCRYDWEGDVEVMDASISMLRVYDTEAAASSWFATATRNRTAEEMQAEMDKVAERVEQSEQLDTEVEKSTARKLLKNIGSKAVHFEDVAGVGDEARVNDDGTVYVRIRNLTFMVSAYKGAKSPPLDYKGVDLQEMADMAKKAAAEWSAETAPQRRADSERLARVITGQL